MDALNLLLSVAVAFVPSIFYMFYILSFDRYQPEPIKILLLSALTGMVASAFSIFVVYKGLAFFLGGVQVWGIKLLRESLFYGFLVFAIPAELAKWVSLSVFLFWNKYYDEYVDGIVYSVCLSMGFVGVLGSCLLLSNQSISDLSLLEEALLVFFVLVPLHFMAGTFMGYFFGLARGGNKIRNLSLALCVPILVEGTIMSLVFLIGTDWMYYCFMAIILSILTMFVYTQVFHLLDKDLGDD